MNLLCTCGSDRRPLRLETIHASGDIAQMLGIEPGSPVIHSIRAIRTTIHTQNHPNSIDELFLPSSLFGEMDLNAFRNGLHPGQSLYAYYEQAFGVLIVETRNTVGLAMAGEAQHSPKGSPDSPECPCLNA